MIDPPDLQALAHHDAPRPPNPDRDHDVLQRQIDALRGMYDAMLTHARTVTHQIADLALRAQRTDSELQATGKSIRNLTDRVEEHLINSDRRDADIDHRLSEMHRSQAEILSAIQSSAETLQQVRDARTAGRVLGGLLRGVSAAVLALGIIGGSIVAAIRWSNGGPQ